LQLGCSSSRYKILAHLAAGDKEKVNDDDLGSSSFGIGSNANGESMPASSSSVSSAVQLCDALQERMQALEKVQVNKVAAAYQILVSSAIKTRTTAAAATMSCGGDGMNLDTDLDQNPAQKKPRYSQPHKLPASVDVAGGRGTAHATTCECTDTLVGLVDKYFEDETGDHDVDGSYDEVAHDDEGAQEGGAIVGSGIVNKTSDLSHQQHYRPHKPFTEATRRYLRSDVKVLVHQVIMKKAAVAADAAALAQQQDGRGPARSCGQHSHSLSHSPGRVTARVLTRILHGISSFCYSRSDWRESPFWARYTPYEFSDVLAEVKAAIASEIA
jgi:hypothetical protein